MHNAMYMQVRMIIEDFSIFLSVCLYCCVCVSIFLFLSGFVCGCRYVHVYLVYVCVCVEGVLGDRCRKYLILLVVVNNHINFGG